MDSKIKFYRLLNCLTIAILLCSAGCVNQSNNISSSEPLINPISMNVKEINSDIDFEDICDIEFSADGKQVVVSDDYKYLYLFRLNENGEWIQTIRIQKPGLSWVKWSPVAPVIALSFDGSLELWDANLQDTIISGKVGSKYAPQMQWSADGERIAVNVSMPSSESHENIAEIYDAKTLTMAAEVKVLPQVFRDTHSLTWNTNSQSPLMVLGGRAGFYFVNGNSVQPYDLRLDISNARLQSFWIDEAKFLLVVNETRIKSEENYKDNIRIILMDGSKQLSEYSVSDAVYDERKIIISSDYDAGQKLLVTYSADKVINLYQIMNDKIFHVGEMVISGMGDYVRVVFDPSGNGVYLFDQQNINFIEFVKD